MRYCQQLKSTELKNKFDEIKYNNGTDPEGFRNLPGLSFENP